MMTFISVEYIVRNSLRATHIDVETQVKIPIVQSRYEILPLEHLIIEDAIGMIQPNARPVCTEGRRVGG